MDSSTSQGLKLSNYDIFCFDMDCTLVNYSIPDLFRLTYSTLAENLVKMGYEKSLLEPLDRDFDFLTRGIVLDSKHGNFLWLADDGTILRACHGRTELTPEEVRGQYGQDGKWARAKELIDKANHLDPDFWIFENFFELPMAVACLRMVELIDQKEGGRQKEYSFAQDARKAILGVWKEEFFKESGGVCSHSGNASGGFLGNFKSHPEKYLHRCSDKLKAWLRDLKKRGKKVVLLTTSTYDYAVHVLSYAIGPDFKDYFTLILTHAQKPVFFDEHFPFLRTADGQEVGELEEGEAYAQGNSKELMKFFSKLLGKENPRVLYAGDSFKADMRPGKGVANWDTVCILEELTLENSYRGQHSSDADSTDSLMDGEGPPYKVIQSKQWGSFFLHPGHPHRDTSGMPRMNTLWSVILRKYSSIAIPCVDILADLSEDQSLATFHPDNPTQLGFYPRAPDFLEQSSK